MNFNLSDVIRGDMKKYGVNGEMVTDRDLWKAKIRPYLSGIVEEKEILISLQANNPSTVI